MNLFHAKFILERLFLFLPVSYFTKKLVNGIILLLAIDVYKFNVKTTLWLFQSSRLFKIKSSPLTIKLTIYIKSDFVAIETLVHRSFIKTPLWSAISAI